MSAPTQKYFKVDARTLLTLGRESIKDHVTAVLELIKNSYDADAQRVEIDIVETETGPLIRIADDGEGMSESQLESSWLRIGYSQKRKNTSTKSKRRATGEKGIGRLSADRLGKRLQIRSKRAQKQAAGLSVDWSLFEKTGADLDTIPILVIQAPTPNLPATAQTGTELLITDLRQGWTLENLHDLRNELSIFVPPLTSHPDFRISLNTGHPEIDGPVQSSFDAKAEIELDASLHKDGRVSYMLHSRNAKGKQQRGQKNVLAWKQLTQKSGRLDSPRSAKPECGPARLRLYFYPRKMETLRGTDLSLPELRAFLDNHSGIRIYRDEIRVRPYGSTNVEQSDWLGLAQRKLRNPAGRGRKAFKIGANQLVGAVFVGRDTNPSLADSSAREGMVHNAAFEDLQRLVLGGVLLLEQHYHASAATTKNKQSSDTPTKVLDQLDQATLAVRSIKQAAESGATGALDNAIRSLPDLLETLERSRHSVDEIASQATVLRGLATIGIAGAVFGHETQTSLAQVLASTRLAARQLSQAKPQVQEAAREVNKAVQHAERVAAWGGFALARVKRDKRRRKTFQLDDVTRGVISAMEPALSASSIKVERKLRPVSGKTFAMDIEAVLINLITNAYSACQQTQRNRRIQVSVGPKKIGGRSGVQLRVADSGPGVAKAFKETIWTPLFSTKVGTRTGQGGTGLGLSIIQSIVDEHEGTRSVEKDAKLKGAAFTVWLPLG